MDVTRRSPETDVTRRPLVRPIALLATLLVAAGAGGMALSFWYLGSNRPLEVTAGAAGFVAGAILLAGGVVALAALGQSPATRELADHAANCLWVFLPPGAAVLAWPTVYFTLFLAGLAFIPFVLLGCAIWAWPVSGSTARGLWGLLGPTGVEPGRGVLAALRWVVFGLQLLAIVASWPLFAEMLHWLESRGYKIGWS